METDLDGLNIESVGQRKKTQGQTAYECVRAKDFSPNLIITTPDAPTVSAQTEACRFISGSTFKRSATKKASYGADEMKYHGPARVSRPLSALIRKGHRRIVVQRGVEARLVLTFYVPARLRFPSLSKTSGNMLCLEMSHLADQ